MLDLSSPPKDQTVLLALKMPSLNHWTAREVSKKKFFFFLTIIIIIRKIKYTYITYFKLRH